MATLTNVLIKDSYDALLKATDNDSIGGTAKRITDGLGNNTPLFISSTQVGIGITPTTELHVSSNAKIGGNLIIVGNLEVQGSTTTIDTSTLSVEDPLIILASNNTSDASDIGFYGKYRPSATDLYSGLFRDATDDKYRLFKDLQTEPTTTVNTSGTGYAVATLVADIEGTLTGTIASTTVATTQSQNDNSTKVATTAYVDAAVDGVDTLAEILAIGNTTGGTDIAVSANDDITFTDSSKAIFGAGSDLQIYHDGSNSYIETSTGSAGDFYIKALGTGHDLYLRATDDINIQPQGGNNGIKIIGQGAVELYHNNSKKFETTSAGATLSGALSITGDGSNAATFTESSAGILTIAVVDDFIVDAEGDIALDANGGDIRFRDNGTNIGSFKNNAGNFQIKCEGSDDDIIFKGNDGGSEITALTLDMSNGGSATFRDDIDLGGKITQTGTGTNTFAGDVSISNTNGNLNFTSGNGNIQTTTGSTSLVFGTNSTERMRLHSSGNIGIGETSPDQKLHVNSGTTNTVAVFESTDTEAQVNFVDTTGTSSIRTRADFRFNSGSTELVRFDSSGNVGIQATTVDDGDLQIGDSNSTFNIALAGPRAKFGYDTSNTIVQGGTSKGVVFCVNNNTLGSGEAMRVNTDGDVLMNCTSVPSGSGGGAAFETSGTLMRLKQSAPSTTTTKVQLYYNANGEVGSIHTSGSATAFNTSSDYRLKDDYKDFNGLDLVRNINVYDFEWKSDKTRSYGVKAHELQEVIPQAVNGEKDGKEMQQVDYSKLVPILLKSIQELQQRIQILENK